MFSVCFARSHWTLPRPKCLCLTFATQSRVCQNGYGPSTANPDTFNRMLSCHSSHKIRCMVLLRMRNMPWTELPKLGRDHTSDPCRKFLVFEFAVVTKAWDVARCFFERGGKMGFAIRFPPPFMLPLITWHCRHLKMRKGGYDHTANFWSDKFSSYSFASFISVYYSDAKLFSGEHWEV